MKNVSILDFGAEISDRVQTQAIQSAIDACFLAGGGRVSVPAGVFLTGGLRLRSHVELHLERGAILRGSRDPADYDTFRGDSIEPLPAEEYPAGTARSAIPLSRWCNGLVRALDAEDIAVTGEESSYFWGDNPFDPTGEENYRGPHGFSFWRCRDIRFEGYTFLDAGNWCHALFQCQNISARKIAVYGGHDGFDVRTCDAVLIEDSLFHTGDDCIAGFDNHDVTVRRCDFQTACSVFRFGGNHVRVEDCRSAPASFGFRGHLSDEKKKGSHLADASCRHEAHTSFNYYCDFRAEIRRTPGDILFRNCKFAGAEQLILLEFDGMHQWCTNRPLASVAFEDCVFEGLSKTGVLHGGKEDPVEYRLTRCRIICRDGARKEPVLLCRNYRRILWEDVSLEGYDDPVLLVDRSGEAEFLRSSPLRLLSAE